MRKFTLPVMAACLLSTCTPASKTGLSVRRQPGGTPPTAHQSRDTPHQSTGTAWILALSDIHLSGDTGSSVFGKDLRSDGWIWTLEKLDSILSGKGSWHTPSLILYTGDLPCHDGGDRERLARLVKDTLINRAAAAGIPIVFARGNNDYPDDYCVKDTGYYDTVLPALHLKIISLNTVPYATGYTSHRCDTCASCNAIRQQVVARQMDWFHSQLDNMKPDEKAIIIMHVPPGKDGFKKAKVVDLWDSSLTVHGKTVQYQFLRLMAKYRERIVGILAGHSHKDGLRILGSSADPTGVIYSIPSISPVYLNNPGFKMMSYDPQTLQWNDIITYYTDQQTYQDTKQWTLGSYSLREKLALTEGPLSAGILGLAKKDPKALTDSVSRFYYVYSNKVNNMDSIERTIFVSNQAH